MRKISIEEYKEITANILFKIDKICQENDLQYYLFYGTLLGAVRHKGFIPWDDDLDIAMPRCDYNKLLEIINQGDYGINFISIETNKSTIFPHGKICDLRTKLYEKNFKNVDGYGAFVDVFPLDYAPNDKRKRLREKRFLMALIIMAEHSARTGFSRTQSISLNFKRACAHLFSRIINTRKILEYINKYLIKRNKEATDYYRIFGFDIFPTKWITGNNKVVFEDHQLAAPKDINSVLKTCYGDYMKFPPKDEQVNKHQLCCYIEENI